MLYKYVTPHWSTKIDQNNELFRPNVSKTQPITKNHTFGHITTLGTSQIAINGYIYLKK
jgi:hypothetical protein